MALNYSFMIRHAHCLWDLWWELDSSPGGWVMEQHACFTVVRDVHRRRGHSSIKVNLPYVTRGCLQSFHIKHGKHQALASTNPVGSLCMCHEKANSLAKISFNQNSMLRLVFLDSLSFLVLSSFMSQEKKKESKNSRLTWGHFILFQNACE